MGVLIGIDGRPLAGARTGSGRYVSELCRVLDRLLPEAQFAVYSNVPVTMPVEGDRWCLRDDKSLLGRGLSPFAWYQFRAGSLAVQDGVSVFWGGANFLPLSLPFSVRTVVTVLDVVHHVHPQSMGWRHRQAFNLFFRMGLRRADIVTAISSGTGSRLARCGYRGADLIVKPGVSGHFCPQTTNSVATMRKRLAIPGPYLLSVSTLEPRKNLATLVTAFVDLRRAGELAGVALLLVGHSGWKNAMLQSALAEADSIGAQIVLPGFVPDDLLPALYAGAEAVIMPSVYEGFGLPVLEARACGARVVATDIPEIREAGGAQVIYVTPDVTGIQEGIRHALQQSQPPPESGELLSWDLEAEKLAKVLLFGKGQM